MPNTVEIIIQGLDKSSPAFKGASKNLSDLQKLSKSTFDLMAAGAAAAAVGGLSTLVFKSIENANAMGNMAQKAGIAVEGFSQLSYAAKLSNVENESLITGIKTLSAEMVKQGRGGEDLTQQLLAQADVFSKMADGADKVRRANELFGRGGQDLIPLLNQGSDAIREQMREADRLGQTISGDFASKANEFNNNLTAIKSTFTGMANALSDVLLPHLLELQTYLLDTGKNARSAADDFTYLFTLWEKTKSFDWMGFLKAGKLPPKGQRPFDIISKNTDEAMATEPQDIKEKPNFPGVTISSPGAINPGDASRIESINAWEKANAEAIVRARELEAQYNTDKLTGSDAERARIDADYQHRLDTIGKLRADEDSSIAASNAAYEAYHANLQRLQMQTSAQWLDVTSQTFGALAQLAAQGGRKQFALTQGLRYGETIMHGAAGIIRAWADPGWPMAIGLTALIAAQTAAQLAVIASQKAPQAHGGLDYVSQNATYELKRGERVLAPRQNEELMAMMRGGFGGEKNINVYIGDTMLGTAVWNASRNGTLTVHPRAVRESV